jgi:hypothetical protein
VVVIATISFLASARGRYNRRSTAASTASSSLVLP